MEIIIESSLKKKIRAAILDLITFPFIFVYIDYDEEKEIRKEDEISKILDDIIDGRNLRIKKKK